MWGSFTGPEGIGFQYPGSSNDTIPGVEVSLQRKCCFSRFSDELMLVRKFQVLRKRFLIMKA